MLPLEITPQKVQEMLAAGERVVLIDCREPFEHQIGVIDGAHLMPMGNIPGRLSAIEGIADESTVVVYCHHGMRSLNVVTWLRNQGVEACTSMAGGIDRWSLEVDSAVPRY